MADKLKQTVPLAVVFGVLAFVWIEIALNFTFHWNSNGDLGNGLGLPANLHLVAPAAFITWGLVFAAGADLSALPSSNSPPGRRRLRPAAPTSDPSGYEDHRATQAFQERVLGEAIPLLAERNIETFTTIDALEQ